LDTRLLHHEIVGDGPRTTLMLHGLLGSGRNLSSLARRWAERDAKRRIVLTDLTGHGRSPRLPEGASLADVAADVLGLVARLSAGTAVDVVGHSLGGRVALKMALLDSAALSDAVLLDIAPGAAEPPSDVTALVAALLAAPARVRNRQDMRRFLLSTGLAPSLTDWLLTNLERQGDGYGWRIDRSSVARFGRAQGAEDLWSAVEQDGSPVSLCVRGGRSRFVSEADADRLRRAGCAVETLPAAGHFVHIDQPGELLDLVTDRDR
jgi:pimeloyl-ACP methyl ester carboxylesterase